MWHFYFITHPLPFMVALIDLLSIFSGGFVERQRAAISMIILQRKIFGNDDAN
jgi:hypothetical protein